MKIKTSELIGPQLDRVVAECVNQALLDPHNNSWELCWNLLGDDSGNYYSPSTDWSQGGPIIEREKMELRYEPECVWISSPPSSVWIAVQPFYQREGGPTPLIAAMRCFVASKLGDEIEIPNELL